MLYIEGSCSVRASLANPLVGLRVARVTRANVVALTRAKSKGRRASEPERERERENQWDKEERRPRIATDVQRREGGWLMVTRSNVYTRLHRRRRGRKRDGNRRGREREYRIAVIAWGGCSKAASSGKHEGERGVVRSVGWLVGWLVVVHAAP